MWADSAGWILKRGTNDGIRTIGYTELMNKKVFSILVVVIVIVVGAYFILWGQNRQSPQAGTPTAPDPTNATYMIAGQPVTLVAGRSEVEAAPGSATKVVTTIFGPPVSGDLNGDGAADAAVILVQNPGGSGTFYYAAAALTTATGTQGTNAVLLGDRIAPQTIEIKNGQVIANYADRAPGEPMTARPSVGVSKYLVVVAGATLQESAPAAGPGERCGGNMTTAPVCVPGYHCAPAPGSHLPFGDVGGTCVAD